MADHIKTPSWSSRSRKRSSFFFYTPTFITLQRVKLQTTDDYKEAVHQAIVDTSLSRRQLVLSSCRCQHGGKFECLFNCKVALSIYRISHCSHVSHVCHVEYFLADC